MFCSLVNSKRSNKSVNVLDCATSRTRTTCSAVTHLLHTGWLHPWLNKSCPQREANRIKAVRIVALILSRQHEVISYSAADGGVHLSGFSSLINHGKVAQICVPHNRRKSGFHLQTNNDRSQSAERSNMHVVLTFLTFPLKTLLALISFWKWKQAGFIGKWPHVHACGRERHRRSFLCCCGRSRARLSFMFLISKFARLIKMRVKKTTHAGLEEEQNIVCTFLLRCWRPAVVIGKKEGMKILTQWIANRSH